MRYCIILVVAVMVMAGGPGRHDAFSIARATASTDTVGPVAAFLASLAPAGLATETCGTIVKQFKDTSTNPPTYTFAWGCPEGICGEGENPPSCQSHSTTQGEVTAVWCSCGEDGVLTPCLTKFLYGPGVRDGAECEAGASCAEENCVAQPGPWVATQDPNKEQRNWSCNCIP